MDFSSSDKSRVQYRMLDSLKFRIRQEINLKDDEIERLRNEILLLQAEMDYLKNNMKNKTDPLLKSVDRYKREIFEVKQSINLDITRLNLNHAKLIQEMKLKHEKRMKDIRMQIENSLLNRNKIMTPKTETKRIKILEKDLENAKSKLFEAQKRESNLIMQKSSIQSQPPAKESPQSSNIEQLNGELQKLKLKKKQLQEKIYAESKNCESARSRNSLSTMSEQQKTTHVQNLKNENNLLKKEIGRLDHMIYGKAGKFSAWRLLQV